MNAPKCISFGKNTGGKILIFFGVKNANFKYQYIGVKVHMINIAKEIYKYGMRVDGPFKSYWYNGKLLEKGIYKNGILEGPYELYFKNGQIEVKRIFKNGVQISCEGSCD